MYEFTSRVRYSEIRPDGTMSLASLITRMQDCSVFHSEDIGRGPEYWLKSGNGWVIIAWQILVHRMPEFGEKVTTRTWSYRFRGIEGDRNFTVKDGEGRLLAEANSLWVYYDREKQLPMRVPQEEKEGFGVEPRLEPFPYAARKIVLPEGSFEVMDPLPVQPLNIDTNGHVNNLVYIEMALEYLPEDFRLHELRVQYMKQARLGDVLVPRLAKDGSACFVSLTDEAGEPYAVVHFL